MSTRPHIDRMRVELEELTSKRNDLVKFVVDSERYDRLTERQKHLLLEQLKTMDSYRMILKERIGLDSSIWESAEGRSIWELIEGND